MDILSIVVIAIVALGILVAIGNYLYSKVPADTAAAHLAYEVADFAYRAIGTAQKAVGLTDNTAIANYAALKLKEKYPNLASLDIEVIVGSLLPVAPPVPPKATKAAKATKASKATTPATPSATPAPAVTPYIPR